MTVPSPLPTADPNAAVGALTSGFTNGVIHVLTLSVPYIVGLLVMFTVLLAVKMHSGAALKRDRESWN